MLSKRFTTLPAESLNKKYGSEALLGHATSYHGDVNLNRDNAMSTSHPCYALSFEDRPTPYISEQKKKKKTNSRHMPLYT